MLSLLGWDDECQAAFDGMKYLLNPPVLVPPVPGSTTSTLSFRNRQRYRSGFVLAQYDDTGKKERAIYYINKSLVEYERKYNSHG